MGSKVEGQLATCHREQTSPLTGTTLVRVIEYSREEWKANLEHGEGMSTNWDSGAC